MNLTQKKVYTFLTILKPEVVSDEISLIKYIYLDPPGLCPQTPGSGKDSRH